MNPAELDFSEFRNRHIWGPADSPGSRQCIDLALLRKPFPYSVEQRDADYGTWEKALDIGRSYLVGVTIPLSEFQRVYTSSLNEWHGLCVVLGQSLAGAGSHIDEAWLDPSHRQAWRIRRVRTAPPLPRW
jgi:hypothetical protein